MGSHPAKCLEMSRNVSKCLKMSRNVSKCLDRDISPYYSCRLHQSLIPNVGDSPPTNEGPGFLYKKKNSSFLKNILPKIMQGRPFAFRSFYFLHFDFKKTKCCHTK